MSWAVSPEASPPPFSARPFPLRGVQITQQSAVLGLLPSLARKCHLISCLISLPLNQWNFPSLSFSQTKIAHAEEDADAARSSVGAQDRVPVWALGGVFVPLCSVPMSSTILTGGWGVPRKPKLLGAWHVLCS